MFALRGWAGRSVAGDGGDRGLSPMRIRQPRADGARPIIGSRIVKHSSTPQARWESDATCVGGTGLREEALEECGEIRKFGGRAAAGLEGYAPKYLGVLLVAEVEHAPGVIP